VDPNTYSEEQPNWQVPTFIPNSGQGERALQELKILKNAWVRQNCTMTYFGAQLIKIGFFARLPFEKCNDIYVD